MIARPDVTSGILMVELELCEKLIREGRAKLSTRKHPQVGIRRTYINYTSLGKKHSMLVRPYIAQYVRELYEASKEK